MTSATCPQCGRSLPAADLIHSSDQRCPGCGYLMNLATKATAAGDEDDSATRPVPREVLAALRPTGDDALDATTRPAPARLGAVSAADVANAGAAGNAALTMQTADLPQRWAPMQGGLDSAAPVDPPNPDGRMGDDAARLADDNAGNAGNVGNGGRLRRPWVAISVVALIVVLLATALAAVFITSPQSGGQPTTARATATTAPTPTATPISALPTLTFTKASLYSLKYPAGWLVTQRNTGGGSFVLISGQQSAGVNPAINIQVIPATESPTDMTTRDDDILKASANSGSIRNQTGPTSVVVGGQTWTQLAADLTLNGTTFAAHAVVLSVAHGQNVFSFFYFAANADFANENTVAFQPALASFTFLT